MRAPRAALALALAAAAAACQDPQGRCDTTADCGANERCDAGVCVRVPPVGGNGSGGGADPASFTPVLWTTLAASASASFGPTSVSADATTGDVLVSGGLAGPFDPWSIATGGFVARATGAGGGFAAALPFPTFSGETLRTASLPGGGFLFAGRAVDPTTLGAYTFVPPAAGSLVLGRLDPAGDPVWAVTVDGTNPAAVLAPVAVASRGGDLVVAGTGAGDFGCGDTGGGTFAAALSAASGTCLWSRGFANRAVSDVEPRPSGEVAVAGLCSPTGASFDPGGGTSCARGLFVAVLAADTGATVWARTSSGSGTITAVHDVAVAPTGAVAVLGDARGAVSFGGSAPTDFGSHEGSFVQLFAAAGAPGALVRPVEAPTAPLRDEVAFDRCAYDVLARLWIAGRYYGQPTLAGLRFSRCRDACLTAAFLARIDAGAAGEPVTGSFLPLRISASPGGAAFADRLVLAATTSTVSLALRFSGDATVGSSRWTADGAGLGALRIVP
jgi:hypothetical protein